MEALPLPVAEFLFILSPREPLMLPARNKGNVLRGALGIALRDAGGEAYSQLFTPAPPAGAAALSNFEAIPRPFVVRPPLEPNTCYAPGEPLRFRLVLVGRAIDALPVFREALARLAEKGIGLNRARAELKTVEPVPYASAPLSGADSITVRFLTPTLLVVDEQPVRQLEFHHLVRRLRDRLNALATFYGAGPLALDFRGIAERAARIICSARDLRWESTSRRSSRTGQRHRLEGFTGAATFRGDLSEFIPLVELGSRVHVGKHCTWGHGWYEWRS